MTKFLSFIQKKNLIDAIKTTKMAAAYKFLLFKRKVVCHKDFFSKLLVPCILVYILKFESIL